MKMNATSNAANPKNLRKRRRNGVRPAVRAEEPKGGGLTVEVLRVRVTLEDEGHQPPPPGGRGAPNPTPKGESGEKQQAPSTPSAGGADKSSENGKKRRLNWQ